MKKIKLINNDILYNDYENRFRKYIDKKLSEEIQQKCYSIIKDSLDMLLWVEFRWGIRRAIAKDRLYDY